MVIVMASRGHKPAGTSGGHNGGQAAASAARRRSARAQEAQRLAAALAPASGTPPERVMTAIFVDGDACPVKAEVEKVAARHGLAVTIVSNGGLRPSANPLLRHVTVAEGADAADDWIVEHIGAGDIAITADIPLAARCLDKGARVLGPNGKPFTPRRHRHGAGDAGTEPPSARSHRAARPIMPALPNRTVRGSWANWKIASQALKRAG